MQTYDYARAALWDAAIKFSLQSRAMTSPDHLVEKHDTRLLIGRIAFLTCGKSDTRHSIGLHRFANENLLCGYLSMYIIKGIPWDEAFLHG